MAGIDLDEFIKSAVREVKQGRSDPKARQRNAQKHAESLKQIAEEAERQRFRTIASQWEMQSLVLCVVEQRCSRCGHTSSHPGKNILINCWNEKFSQRHMKSVREEPNWEERFGHLPKEYRTESITIDSCMNCFTTIGESQNADDEAGEDHGQLLPGRAGVPGVRHADPEPEYGQGHIRLEVDNSQPDDSASGPSPSGGSEHDQRSRHPGESPLAWGLDSFLSQLKRSTT